MGLRVNPAWDSLGFGFFLGGSGEKINTITWVCMELAVGKNQGSSQHSCPMLSVQA